MNTIVKGLRGVGRNSNPLPLHGQVKSLRGLGDTYYPITGDIVNVLADVIGKKTDGTQYVIKAGSFWTPNVVQIETSSVAKNYLKINDGTDNSPIYATYLDNKDSFELANSLNTYLFKPWAATSQVVTNVATKTLDTAQTVANAALDTTKSAAQTVSNTVEITKYLLPAGLAAGALFLGVYAYKHYIKGNDKIKSPKISVL